MIIDGIPLRLYVSKNKMKPLNINQYRNNHFQIKNKMKAQMHAIIQEKCRGMGKPKLPVELIYTIYRPNKRKVDLSNIGSVVDKFVADGLVSAGLIPDDNVNIIKKTSYVDGGIDKQNPRACLEIKHYKVKKNERKVSEVDR